MDKENYISSFHNPRIKEILSLKRGREREKEKLILVEGRREIESARSGGAEIKKIFYCPELAGRDLSANLKKSEIFSVPPSVFKKISYREHPDGILAVAVPPQLKLKDLKLSSRPFLVILETVEKPGNLGAILRSAEACGAEAVIINDFQTDIYNPNVVRASLGAVFLLPAIKASREETKKWLKEKKINVLAATPAGKKNYAEVNWEKPAAILLGAEDKGLSNFWLREADEKIKIPMKGKIDSLNVSVSAAILLFEAWRQRGFS